MFPLLLQPLCVAGPQLYVDFKGQTTFRITDAVRPSEFTVCFKASSRVQKAVDL